MCSRGHSVVCKAHDYTLLSVQQCRQSSVKGAYHKGLWCLWADQSLWIRSGRNSTGCRRSPVGSLSLAWLALANLFWLLRPSDITVSSKVTTYLTYLCYCEQNQWILLFQWPLWPPSFPPSSECFPGGIHWLSIGQLDKPDLLVKIQALCFRLEQGLDSQSLHRPPNSLDEAKERLRYLMLRRYPKWVCVLVNIIYLCVITQHHSCVSLCPNITCFYVWHQISANSGWHLG